MLIHCVSYDGKRIAINTTNIISIEAFDYEKTLAQAAGAGPDLSTLVAIGRMQQDRANYEKARTLVALSNNTSMLVRDSFAEVRSKFSLVSEPIIPGR